MNGSDKANTQDEIIAVLGRITCGTTGESTHIESVKRNGSVSVKLYGQDLCLHLAPGCTVDEIVRTAHKLVEAKIDKNINDTFSGVKEWLIGMPPAMYLSPIVIVSLLVTGYNSRWRVAESKEESSWWIEFDAPDNISGEVETQRCRTFFMPETFGKIVDMVRCAVQFAEMHEMNECFKFDGEDIYNPHKSQIDK